MCRICDDEGCINCDPNPDNVDINCDPNEVAFTKEDALKNIVDEVMSEMEQGIDFWIQNKGIVLTRKKVMAEIQRQLDKEEEQWTHY